MKILILFIKGFFRKIVRRFYWFYRFMQADTGHGFCVKFPIKVEGKGTLSFGKNCKLAEHIYFGCGEGSRISFGNNCRIEKGVEIITGKNAVISFGDNCWIMRNTIIRTSNNFEFSNDIQIATNCAIFSRESGHEGILKVGEGTHIGDYTIVDVSDNMTIGNEVALGANCVIYTHDHDYTNKDKASWKGGVIKHPVLIKDGAWIGSSVTILSGVEINSRAVIAAGAVVTKDAESNSIYGGVPAKFIKLIE